MMRTRPWIALLGIAFGTALAVAGWRVWRMFLGENVAEPVGPGAWTGSANRQPSPAPQPPSTAGSPPSQAAPPPAAPVQPTPPPMPFGTVFDPLAAVEDTPSLYRQVEAVEEDEVATALEETDESAEAASELAESLVAPAAGQSSGGPTIQERFGPNAATTIAHGVCPDDHPVKGNANSKI